VGRKKIGYRRHQNPKREDERHDQLETRDAEHKVKKHWLVTGGGGTREERKVGPEPTDPPRPGTENTMNHSCWKWCQVLNAVNVSKVEKVKGPDEHAGLVQKFPGRGGRSTSSEKMTGAGQRGGLSGTTWVFHHSSLGRPY